MRRPVDGCAALKSSVGDGFEPYGSQIDRYRMSMRIRFFSATIQLAFSFHDAFSATMVFNGEERVGG
jgi:hypothetical protein